MKRLRLATFNLENLEDRELPDGADFADRLAVLRPQLQRLRADIVCLQEVNAHRPSKHAPRRISALEPLLQDTPYAGFHQCHSTYHAGDHLSDHHNLVTLSRFPIRAHRQIWHHFVPPQSSDDEAPVQWERPVLLTQIDLPGQQSITVINVHLRAPRAAWIGAERLPNGAWVRVGDWARGFHLAAQKQIGQALEIRLLCEEIFDADPMALLAVCGDFNAADRDAALRIIRGDEEDTGNGHLAIRSLIPVERNLAADRCYSVIHHGKRIMLDHILASRPLLGRLLLVDVHNETLGDEVTAASTVLGSPDSFHAPMVAEFSLS